MKYKIGDVVKWETLLSTDGVIGTIKDVFKNKDGHVYYRVRNDSSEIRNDALPEHKIICIIQSPDKNDLYKAYGFEGK